MTGLGVLYAKEAAKRPEWGSIPDRDKTGRLREVYWAHSAAGKLNTGRKPFVSKTLNWWAGRAEIGRRRDQAGDGFIYLINMTSQRVDHRFEWLEVTEVFTTVPAWRVEGAMREWNDIPDTHPVDFDEFQKGLRRGRPSRVEQRRAADEVIEAINKKLAKTEEASICESMRLLLLDIDAFAFEHLVKRLLEEMDYQNVDITTRSRDGGVKAIAEIELGITSVREVVQAKRHKRTIQRKDHDAMHGSLYRFDAVPGHHYRHLALLEGH